MFFLNAVYTGYSGTNSILKLIGLIILCVLIIAASYFVTRLIGNRESGMSGSANFRSIDAYRLSPNKYLQLIQAGERYFVIAVSKDNVTLICELRKEEIRFKNSPGMKASFKDILSKMAGKKDTVPEDDAVNGIDEASGEEPEKDGSDSE